MPDFSMSSKTTINSVGFNGGTSISAALMSDPNHRFSLNASLYAEDEFIAGQYNLLGQYSCMRSLYTRSALQAWQETDIEMPGLLPASASTKEGQVRRFISARDNPTRLLVDVPGVRYSLRSLGLQEFPESKNRILLSSSKAHYVIVTLHVERGRLSFSHDYVAHGVQPLQRSPNQQSLLLMAKPTSLVQLLDRIYYRISPAEARDYSGGGVKHGKSCP